MARAKGVSLGFMAALCICVLQGAGGETFVIKNDCAFPVWAASSTGGGKRLDNGQSWTPEVPVDGWTWVTFWGRTGCSFNDSGVGNCVTGDCKGLLNCTGDASVTYPITMAEYSSENFEYDISLVNGFNLPMSIIPSDSSCEATSCSSNITAICPAKLNASNGCKSACDALGSPEYCCQKGGYSETLYCGPTNYSRYFKNHCSQAKTYADDTNDVKFSCAAETHYKVFFCSAPASYPSPAASAVFAPVNSGSAPASYPSPAASAVFAPVNSGSAPASYPSPAASAVFAPVNSEKLSKPVFGRGIIAALISGAALMMAIALMLGWKKFRTKKNLNEDCLTIMVPNSTKSRAFTFVEITESTQNFNQKIGQGGFGSVFFGKLREGRDIAVKVLSSFSIEGVHQFQNEVDLLSKIHHKNLVSLLGFCNESKDVMLIYEHMSEGSLRDHLYGSRVEISPLNWKTRLKIALDAAHGLEYLHMGCTPKIIHRDVKTANILLDYNMNGKLADFGLSRISVDGEASYANTAVKGTIGYLDPEYFRTQMLTAKSDVYSFGVVLLEMICGRPPINVNLREEELNLVQWVTPYVKMDENANEIEEIIDKRMDGNYHIVSIVKVAKLAFRCLEATPSSRPSVSEVVTQIKEAIICENENNSPPPISEGIDSHLQASDVHPRAASIPRKMEWADNSSNLAQVGR